MVGEVPTALWPKPVNVFSLIFFDIFWMFFELASGVSVSGAVPLFWVWLWWDYLDSNLDNLGSLPDEFPDLCTCFAVIYVCANNLRRFWSVRVMLARSTLTFLKTKMFFECWEEEPLRERPKTKDWDANVSSKKICKRTRSQTLPSLLKAQERTPAS